MFRPCPPLGLFVLASLPAAQQFDTPRNVVAHGVHAPGPGEVTATVAGNFTEDFEPDVVVLQGGVPKLSYASYLFDAVRDIEPSLTAVQSIAAVRGRSPKAQDVLVATDWRGLVAVPFDVASGSFTTPIVISAGDWVDARLLRTHEDAGGTGYVFALNGPTELISRVESGPGSGVFNAGASFFTLQSVLDYVPLDWNDDGVLDLAFLTAGGSIEVYQADGTPIRNLAHTFRGGVITRVTDGGGTDYLAWATKNGSNTFYDLTLRNEASWNAPIVDIELRVPKKPGVLGTPTLELDMRQMVAGDFNGGGEDLVLIHATNESAYVLKDVDPSSDIDYDRLKVCRFGMSTTPFATPAAAVAPAATRNLNNDQGLAGPRRDLALVTNDEDAVWVYCDISLPTPSVLSPKKRPKLGPPGGAGKGGGFGGGAYGGSYEGGTRSNSTEETGIQGGSHDVLVQPDDFYLDFRFANLGSATHVQIVVWHQDEGMGLPVSATENILHPFGNCTGSTRHAVELTVPQALGAPPPRPLYYFQYRLVTVVGQDIVEAGESQVGVVAVEVTPGEFQQGPLVLRFLEDNLEATGPLGVALGNYTCITYPDGNAILGVVYKDTLPPVPPDGQIPNPGFWWATQTETVNH